eukprot:CAMPEP_0202892058 /NCGR_PEP_ID=MMETSP1392-20130828/1906_1 /ASSEMBLY_ACC=CAM_ASM_000868 /TAXON_ID=225041 /ORGANISM="Chlamydomonas chlamydogama, Strain SAG 11-48b" /LENGTH=154 /DNA_ID=CAMNT_0049575933 /DNA_START=16 /DNA_END=477 /DNA_ORIENTATION=+
MSAFSPLLLLGLPEWLRDETTAGLDDGAGNPYANTLAHVQQQRTVLLKYAGFSEELVHPPVNTLERHVMFAKQMRSAIDRYCTKTLCAVCNIRRVAESVKVIPFSQLPGLDLLAADAPKTTKHPRASQTVWRVGAKEYCLASDACGFDECNVCE